MATWWTATYCFSILWWIELVLRDCALLENVADTRRFSILWWIELVLRDGDLLSDRPHVEQFQYPLVDRVGFEGQRRCSPAGCNYKFQYPLVDRVGFEGPRV